jgi:AcrR family transcriptional regulator
MGPRAYLRPEERRRQLLDATSRLFDRGGFTAITVSAVAAEAGASRRLVYDHFADLGDLYAAFFDDRVARYAEAIDAASTPSAPGEPRSLAGAVGQLLAIGAEDLRAIHLLLADTATPELSSARDALRAHLQARWLPALGALGVELEVAGALLWTLASSFVTLAELVHRGELTAAAAESMASAMVATLPELVGRLAPESTTTPEVP